MHMQPFVFQGTQGDLEAKLFLPEQRAEEQMKDAVVVLHPHPLYGGTMENKVVTTIVKAFSQSNAAVLIFNFPGVGKSAGVFQKGEGEVKDALLAVQLMQKKFPTASISVAGFSFGAYVAYSLTLQTTCKRIVLIAPPVTHFPMNTKHPNLPPCLVVQGEKDEVINAEAVYQWASEYVPSAPLIRFPDTGHFFHGKLLELKKEVVQFWDSTKINLA